MRGLQASPLALAPCPCHGHLVFVQPVESARKMMDDEDFYREIMILRACRDTNILQVCGVCWLMGGTRQFSVT